MEIHYKCRALYIVSYERNHQRTHGTDQQYMRYVEFQFLARVYFQKHDESSLSTSLSIGADHAQWNLFCMTAFDCMGLTMDF